MSSTLSIIKDRYISNKDKIVNLEELLQVSSSKDYAANNSLYKNNLLRDERNLSTLVNHTNNYSYKYDLDECKYVIEDIKENKLKYQVELQKKMFIKYASTVLTVSDGFIGPYNEFLNTLIDIHDLHAKRYIGIFNEALEYYQSLITIPSKRLDYTTISDKYNAVISNTELFSNQINNYFIIYDDENKSLKKTKQVLVGEYFNGSQSIVEFLNLNDILTSKISYVSNLDHSTYSKILCELCDLIESKKITITKEVENNLYYYATMVDLVSLNYYVIAKEAIISLKNLETILKAI